VHRIKPGVKVCVEYTPTVWSARKSRDGVAKFGSGCSLKLQAVILLEEGLHFGSQAVAGGLEGVGWSVIRRLKLALDPMMSVSDLE
jgi:hypothetical protein